MSEAQHEACLGKVLCNFSQYFCAFLSIKSAFLMKSSKNDIKECFTTDSMIQSILSDYENSVTSDWIDSAPTVAEIKHCVEKYIPSVMPSGSCSQNGKCELDGNGNNPSESNGVISGR